MKKTKKVERKVHNKYEVKVAGRGLVFKALKTLANSKQRVDTVTLNAKQVTALKSAAKKSKDAYFTAVDEMIVKPCKIDSASKKAGLSIVTGYDAAHYSTAKVLGIALKK